jgi:flagellar motility protein MotE (MotC chaperone)
MEVTTAELILLVTTIGNGVGWWFDRRDAQSAVAKATEEANKTIARWEDTAEDLQKVVTAQERELDRKEEEIARRDGRIAHLESLLFSSDGAAT